MRPTRSAGATSPDPAPAEARKAWIDCLKALAILAVVFTHAGVPKRWDEYSTWDVVLRTRWVAFHVPLFLMASGYLYYRATAATWREVGRRLARILVPYALASALFLLLQPAPTPQPPLTLDTALHQLATGSAIGIFYYVFLIALLTPLVWPLSRLDRRAGLALVAVSAVVAVASLADARFALDRTPFWSLRNPLNFFLTYFLAGWVAASYAPELERFVRRHRRALAAACTVAIGLYLAYYFGSVAGWEVPLSRAPSRLIKGGVRSGYAFSVAVLVLAVALDRSAPAFVRFLSEASFGIFVYHRLFMWAVLPAVLDWHPLARTLALVAVGLAGASLLCALGRRFLGPRSKLLLGY